MEPIDMKPGDKKLVITDMIAPEDAVVKMRDFMDLVDGEAITDFDSFVEAYRETATDELVDAMVAATALASFTEYFKRGVTMLLGQRGYRLKAKVANDSRADSEVATALSKGYEILDRTAKED